MCRFSQYSKNRFISKNSIRPTVPVRPARGAARDGSGPMKCHQVPASGNRAARHTRPIPAEPPGPRFGGRPPTGAALGPHNGKPPVRARSADATMSCRNMQKTSVGSSKRLRFRPDFARRQWRILAGRRDASLRTYGRRISRVFLEVRLNMTLNVACLAFGVVDSRCARSSP